MCNVSLSLTCCKQVIQFLEFNSGEVSNSKLLVVVELFVSKFWTFHLLTFPPVSMRVPKRKAIQKLFYKYKSGLQVSNSSTKLYRYSHTSDIHILTFFFFFSFINSVTRKSSEIIQEDMNCLKASLQQSVQDQAIKLKKNDVTARLHTVLVQVLVLQIFIMLAICDSA